MNKRKVASYAAIGVLGLLIGTAGGSDASDDVPQPIPTVTVTHTEPVPGPTVTVTEKVPGPTVTVTAKAVAAPKVSPKPAYIAPQPAPVYYKNCDAARAAGAAPVYRGDPGYGPHLDRDNDGIGCE